MSQSKVQHIFRVFDALNVVKGIKAVGGPDHQTYYIESDVYAPDRRITPLILQPYVEVSDPNGVIPAGDKIGELSSASWYVGEAILANKITDKESEATLDTPFAIGENNALHVRKNSTKSILLIFEGEYLDIRKDKNIHISLTYTLTTTSNTEVKPAPKLMLSKPQSWKYCPLENQTKAVIEATVSQDSKLYRSAVQWVKVEGDKETLIGEDDPFYIEGQNTDKLTINPSLMGSTLIRAKNHDELLYNQVYGINPEWDHRMDEVMRNRNLLSYSSNLWESGHILVAEGINSPIMKEVRVRTVGYIEAKPSTYYSISATQKKIFRTIIIYEYDENEEFIRINGGLSEWNETNFPFAFQTHISTAKLRVVIDTSGYGNMMPSSVKKYNIKLEEGSVATPYTPAPEDLNSRNYIYNSSFEKMSGNKPLYTSIVGSGIFIQRVKTEIDGVFAVEFTSDSGGNTGKNRFNVYSKIENDYSGPILFSFYAKRMRGVGRIGLAIDGTGSYQWNLQANNEWEFCSLFLQKNPISKATFAFLIGTANDVFHIKEIKLNKGKYHTDWNKAAEDYSPDGILKGTYQSDIKFTRYFPKLESEIDFLTGDTLRAGMDTVKMKAVFKTNKEEIKNPEQYFDIKWYLDPVEAGGSVEFLGEGEYLDVPISKIPLKARAIPFRLEYEFK